MGERKKLNTENNMKHKKKTYNVGGLLGGAAKKAKKKSKKAYAKGGKVMYSYGGKKKAK